MLMAGRAPHYPRLWCTRPVGSGASLPLSGMTAGLRAQAGIEPATTLKWGRSAIELLGVPCWTMTHGSVKVPEHRFAALL